ncbi:MAG: hypothetical protein ACKVZ6_20910, partial [Kineosporiaceae bacterium]
CTAGAAVSGSGFAAVAVLRGARAAVPAARVRALRGAVRVVGPDVCPEGGPEGDSEGAAGVASGAAATVGPPVRRAGSGVGALLAVAGVLMRSIVSCRGEQG